MFVVSGRNSRFNHAPSPFFADLGAAAGPLAKGSPPPKIHRLTVQKSGQIMRNDQAIELAALKPTLVAMKASDPETTIVVRGAADVEYQRMISVLDALQQADITKIGLATETTQ